MSIATDPIPDLDINKDSEFLSVIAQYDLCEDNDLRETNDKEYPAGSLASIKARVEGSLLSSRPASLPASFLISRLRAIMNKETATIENDTIEMLKSCLLGKEKLSITTEITLDQEARNFCNRHNLLKYIPIVSDIIKRSFFNISSIDTEVLQDPDSDSQWFVINVEVSGDVDTVLDMYDRYAEEWVSRVPWPDRDKISLSYSII